MRHAAHGQSCLFDDAAADIMGRCYRKPEESIRLPVALAVVAVFGEIIIRISTPMISLPGAGVVVRS